MTLLEKVDQYRALLDEKERLKELVAENNRELEKCRDELAQMMIDEECPKISRSGYCYTLQQKTHYSKKAGAEERLFELLRENGLGDVIKETVHAQTLQGVMSELAEENGGELPPEFAEVVSIYEYTDVARRREHSR